MKERKLDCREGGGGSEQEGGGVHTLGGRANEGGGRWAQGQEAIEISSSHRAGLGLLPQRGSAGRIQTALDIRLACPPGPLGPECALRRQCKSPALNCLLFELDLAACVPHSYMSVHFLPRQPTRSQTSSC